MALLDEEEIRRMTSEERKRKILELRTQLNVSDPTFDRSEVKATIRLLKQYQQYAGEHSDSNYRITELASVDNSPHPPQTIKIFISNTDVEGNIQDLQEDLGLTDEEISKIEVAVRHSISNICDMENIRLEEDLRTSAENVVLSMILQEINQVV